MAHIKAKYHVIKLGTLKVKEQKTKTGARKPQSQVKLETFMTKKIFRTFSVVYLSSELIIIFFT